MKFAISVICAAALFAAGCVSPGGDSGGWTDEDVAQLALDFQDVAQVITTYDLTENPEHRQRIVQVEAQLRTLGSAYGTVSFSEILTILQPYFAEVKSPEALTAVTLLKISLRRVGVSLDSGKLTKIKPLILGLADGVKAGLETVPQ
jgi:hypothetical protein